MSLPADVPARHAAAFFPTPLLARHRPEGIRASLASLLLGLGILEVIQHLSLGRARNLTVGPHFTINVWHRLGLPEHEESGPPRKPN
jgi:hypothetical protein